MQNHHPGISATEYALFAGLLAVTAIAGLNVLGGSVSSLLSASDTRLSAPNTLSVLAPIPSAQVGKPAGNSENPDSGSPLPYKGSGYYAVLTDSATGMPKLQLTDGTAGGVKNVSSVDGNQLNALGSLLLARKLDEMASQQTDPEIKDYYGQMAKLAYYMGAAEGELDDVAGLHLITVIDGRKYSNGDALRDLNQYHAQLDTLMQNPPPGINPQEFGVVMPMAVEVFNIGHNYVNQLSDFIKPNGDVTANFKVDAANRDDGPAAGSTFRQIDHLIPGGTPTGKSYETYMPYTELKSTVATVLAKSVPVLSQPVETTWTDATAIDTHALPSSAPTNKITPSPNPASKN